MHYLYIQYSEKLDRYYSGQTHNVNERILKHNKGYSAATKRGTPWQLKKIVEFENKTEAIMAENWLKRMKSRRVIEQVISGEIDIKKLLLVRTPVPNPREGREFPPAGGSDRKSCCSYFWAFFLVWGHF